MTHSLSIKSHIAVLGYGVEGQGTVAYLRKHGFLDVTVVDERQNIDVPEGVALICGPRALEALHGFEVIFRSPGIWRRRPEILLAEAAGALITSQVEYFLSKAVCTVIGVTGTKGKSTTTSLLRHILASSGRDVYLAGNIGSSVIELLDEVSVGSTVILELSSFQLQDIRVSPRVAIVLGITIEHQDIHLSLQEYIDAKAGIARHQREGDVVICAPDNGYAAEIAELSPAAQRWSWCASGDQGCVLPRGMQLGAFCRDEALWLQQGSLEQRLMDRADVPLLGDHMLQNVLPAVICASLQGMRAEDICAAVKTFPGVPHRMEYLGDVLGMSFYNDSSATTPEAAIAAIQAHKNVPLAIILGGGQKGVSLEGLAKTAATAPHVRHIILAGSDAAAVLAQHLEGMHPRGVVHRVADYSQLPALLRTIQADGMCVVLSPGCTSFDLFRDYKDRGQTFRDVVNLLRAPA